MDRGAGSIPGSGSGCSIHERLATVNAELEFRGAHIFCVFFPFTYRGGVIGPGRKTSVNLAGRDADTGLVIFIDDHP